MFLFLLLFNLFWIGFNTEYTNRIQYMGSWWYVRKSTFEKMKDINSSISSLGQREFVNMLPLVCNDAVAILFMFDLTRKSTLVRVNFHYQQLEVFIYMNMILFSVSFLFSQNSIKEWYRQARGFNKVFTFLSKQSCYMTLSD